MSCLGAKSLAECVQSLNQRFLFIFTGTDDPEGRVTYLRRSADGWATYQLWQGRRPRGAFLSCARPVQPAPAACVHITRNPPINPVSLIGFCGALLRIKNWDLNIHNVIILIIFHQMIHDIHRIGGSRQRKIGMLPVELGNAHIYSVIGSAEIAHQAELLRQDANVLCVVRWSIGVKICAKATLMNQAVFRTRIGRDQRVVEEVLIVCRRQIILAQINIPSERERCKARGF